MKSQRRRTRIASALCAGVLVVGLAACSSSDDGGSAEATADESALGAPNKATGTPVTFGFIGEGAGQTINSVDETKGAIAAINYANEYLGGLGGHPITLKVCESLGVPTGATDCASQMVAAKVSAVLGGSNGQADQVISVLAPAGIPMINHTQSTQAGLTTPGIFSMFNGLSYFGGPAGWAADEGIKSVDQIVIAVPAAEGAAKIGETLFKNAGLSVTTTSIAPGVADMTPQITSAANDNPGLYHINGSADFCTSAIKAVKTVDPDAKMSIIERCIAAGNAASIPGGYEGLKVAVSADLDTTTPDGKLFSAIIAKYGDGADISSMTSAGYAPALGTVNALNAANITDTSPAGVLAALKTAPPTEYPNSGGILFQCNSKPIAFAPNICSADGILATADKDGNLSDYQKIAADPALYKMPGS
ncbi:ABC transporter substrate-binding protein [Williamsia sp. DF01-3]|uniref:ABC transporter substrate-binding protein n=1 Tax=Williamsia sp. DF01-3 TaxID=2934157 RepID=UPI001FF5B075|nr:ABC transporter substrate-binding protein [Williamsia sp. DF01-3]MCK0516779.1 ABC transporter substrate-binding protein [Williamsia sp. DF01-3]